MPRKRTKVGDLTRLGPHRILRGDLGFAGLPGVVYTPESGADLPGVAFGHDWLSDADDYTGTLEHLASWGIVAAAPDTHRGLTPSAPGLAHDLAATLDIICGVRLGSGQVSVSEDRLGLVGHGFGGAAAVLAAAGEAQAAAVAAVFPSVTKPSAEAAAANLTTPGLVLATPDDAASLRTDALGIAAAWDGAVLRVVDKAHVGDLAEKRGITRLLRLPVSATKTQRTVRSLVTGFLRFALAGEEACRQFADPDAEFPNTSRPDPNAPPVTPQDRIVALFR